MREREKELRQREGDCCPEVPIGGIVLEQLTSVLPIPPKRSPPGFCGTMVRTIVVDSRAARLWQSHRDPRPAQAPPGPAPLRPDESMPCVPFPAGSATCLQAGRAHPSIFPPPQSVPSQGEEMATSCGVPLCSGPVSIAVRLPEWLRVGTVEWPCQGLKSESGASMATWPLQVSP